MFIFLESTMKEKLLKLIGVTASVALAVVGGIIVAVLILPISPAPERLAAFKAWEAQQTRQDSRGAAQSGEAAP
jgi:hypothetical protein